MADNKNQHYVPRCHLRPFSVDGQNKAINLFNVSRKQAILGAPVKSQCSRDYFYGKDEAVEPLLQFMEGRYSAVIKKIEADPKAVGLQDLITLRTFTLLQTYRTYGQVEKLKAMAQKQHEAIVAAAGADNVSIPRPFKTQEDAVLFVVSIFADIIKKRYVDDLEMILVINTSKRKFFTSDDPAVHTNKYHFQKLGDSSFGVGNSGTMYFLPLTESAYFIAYDSNVYVAPDRVGHVVEVRRDIEADSFNELQVLHARENLYFRDAQASAAVGAALAEHGGRRPTHWHTTEHFELTEKSSSGEKFVKREKLEVGKGREFLSAVSNVSVQPSRWTKVLQYRIRPRVVDTGTGAGVLRPGHPLLTENR